MKVTIRSYELWVMGTTTAYAREGTVEIVHWPSPVRFGTSVTPLGKVVPMHYVQFVKYIFPRNRTTSN